MALTIDHTPRPWITVPSILNGRRAVVKKITIGEYLTDGLALAPSDVGMTEIDAVIPLRDHAGYSFSYDQTNDKLLVYTTAATQLGNGVNPSIAPYFLVVGT